VFQPEELERYHRHCGKSIRTPLSKQDASDAKAKIEAAIK
jgi:hypothetical protein